LTQIEVSTQKAVTALNHDIRFRWILLNTFMCLQKSLSYPFMEVLCISDGLNLIFCSCWNIWRQPTL